MRIERLNNPSACPAIPFGPTGMTGAINQNAEIDCFARAGGAAGQRYQVRVVETSGAATLLFEVVRPDGTTVCGPTGSPDASCLLDAAGTNRIYVYASGGLQPPTTGSCSSASPTRSGARRRRSAIRRRCAAIDDPGEIDCVTFTGSASQDVRVRSIPVAGALNPVTEVLRPDGTTVCATTFSDDFVCDLTPTASTRSSSARAPATARRPGPIRCSCSIHPEPRASLATADVYRRIGAADRLSGLVARSGRM